MLGRTRIALLAGILTLGIAGCGGDDGTIPKDNSEDLLGKLTQLQDQIDRGECTVAEGTASQINEAVQNLPNDVDPEVQDALNKGAENLANLTPEQCTEGGATGAAGVETTDETTSSTSTTTTTTSTETTTPTDTTPTEDTTEEPPSETPPGQQTPPGNGGGNEGNQGTPGGDGGDTGGPSGGITGGKR
jgi:hypothetical protein